jgi:hypothetical protein
MAPPLLDMLGSKLLLSPSSPRHVRMSAMRHRPVGTSRSLNLDIALSTVQF